MGYTLFAGHEWLAGEVIMRNDFAQALIACFRLYKQSHSIGSRRLYDAVNAAFCESALATAWDNIERLR